MSCWESIHSSETNSPQFCMKYNLYKEAYIYIDVSENSGTPKSSILIGFSIINHPFWGTHIFGNTHIFLNRWLVFYFVGKRNIGINPANKRSPQLESLGEKHLLLAPKGSIHVSRNFTNLKKQGSTFNTVYLRQRTSTDTPSKTNNFKKLIGFWTKHISISFFSKNLFLDNFNDPNWKYGASIGLNLDGKDLSPGQWKRSQHDVRIAKTTP